MRRRFTLEECNVKKGTRVYARGKSRQFGFMTGHTRDCSLESCSGTRVRVRWKDGEITWPCLKGMTQTKSRAYKIL